MSQKRRFEEYHDPDYPQPGVSGAKRLRAGEEFGHHSGGGEDVISGGSADKTDRIRAIVRREFERELALKEQELNRIEHKLLQAKRLLQRVRYAVVFSYYTKKNLEYSESEQRNELTMASVSSETVVVEPNASVESQVAPAQKAVHPSLKKLLGKTTIDYNEILKIRPARQAAKDAKTSIADKLRSKKDERRLRMAPTETVINHSICPASTSAPSVSEPVKVPRYVSPTKIDRPFDKINTARGRNQSRHLIAVGNTSKYIGDDKSQQGVTHKWLVYVRTKTDEASVEEIVSKVRFFLHPSYRPNDVVEVDSSPFQISRRGWGEFPIRVQLYFHAHIDQKPLQIFHNLVLDKKLTGLQTMGAETVVEMWLKLPPRPKPPMLSPLPPPPPQSPRRGQMTPTRKIVTPKKAPLECVPTMSAVETVTNMVEIPPAVPESTLLNEEPEPPVWDHESIISDDFKSPRATSFMPEQCNGNAKSEPGVTIKFENNTTLMKPPAARHPVAPVVLPPSVQTKTGTPPAQPRKLMKCLDSNGKVILVEIQVDPNNPKSFKIIKKPNPLLNPMKMQPIKSTLVAPSTPPANAITPPAIRIGPQTPITSTKPPMNGIPTIPPGRVIVLPKSSLTNFTKGSTSAKPTTTPRLILKPNQIQPTTPIPQLQRVPNPTAIRPILKSATNPTTITKSQLPPAGLIKPNNVIMRNGKVFIIDPTKVIAKSVLTPQQPVLTTPKATPTPTTHPSFSTTPKPFSSTSRPKQQSLLKPQISLLKPRPGVVVPAKPPQTTLRLKPTPTIAPQRNHLSNGGHPRLQMLQRRSIELPRRINGGHPPIGRLMRLPNVILPPEKSVFNHNGNRIVLHPPRRDYRRELEHQFLRRRHFDNRRSAVEFLLRQVPLVHRLAAEHNPEFGQAFPFAVGSTQAFEGMLLPKQRSVEWCRANFIGRLLHKHPELRSLPTWTTRDIVLFARQFGFTPHAVLPSSNPANPDPTGSDPNDAKSTLSSLIKKEMKRELAQHETLTVNQRIVDWLGEWNNKRSHRRLAADDGLVINVDDDDDEAEVKNGRNGKVKEKAEVKSLRPIAWLPLDTQLRAENALVTEVCHSMQIKLPPEEIVPGVLHNSAQLVMVTAMQSFIADLLRRAHGARKEPDSESSSQPAVTIDDLRSCLTHTAHFDFLTNRYFGATQQHPTTTDVKTEPSTSS